MAKEPSMPIDDSLPTTRVVEYRKDGNAIMAVYGDFTNLQESPAGFGTTKAEALADLVEKSGRGTTLGEPVIAFTQEVENIPEPVAPQESVEAAIATDTREGRWKKLDPTRARPVAAPEAAPIPEAMEGGTDTVTIERDNVRLAVSRLAFRDLYEPHGYAIIGESE